MLTEKAIRDFSWCPTLFRETEGNAKRIKPDRNRGDDVLEAIQSAVTTGTANKRAIPTKTTLGYKADPYEEDFWIVIEAGNSQLLLTLHEVRLEKRADEPWSLTARRRQKKKPRAEDTLKIESLVRRLIAVALKSYFPRVTITVETKYEDYVQPFKTSFPTEEEYDEALSMIQEIQEAVDGERSLQANTDRCGICWWRDKCPVGSSRERPTGPSTGTPQRGIV